MDANTVLITLFVAAILLTVSCVVVYRWSLGRIPDDLSGIMGAIGVLVAAVFIFSTGGEHINGAGTELAKTLEIFMRPVAIGASAWTGFTFGGTAGLTIALVLTLPGLFPGVTHIEKLYAVGSNAVSGVGNAVSGVGSAFSFVGSAIYAPFKYLFGSSAIKPEVNKEPRPAFDGNEPPAGGRRRKLRR